MRLLSSLEKDLCNQIIKHAGPNNFIGNIIDKHLQNVCIVVNRNNNSVSLEFTIRNNIPSREETNAIFEKLEEISMLTLQLVNLLQLLIKDGYIMMLKRSGNSQPIMRFGGCIGNMPSVPYTFSDENITKLLLEYSDKEIYSTEEFKRFCEKGHIARDEQRFIRQITITQTALVITVLALLFNIYINLFYKKNNTVTLNNLQMQSIHESIEKIYKALMFKEKKASDQKKQMQPNLK
ncbi:MAG: hypothetical protein LBF27_01150 [Sphingobacterium sp.]|jgi:hypothetical protein|nr:hypothetical protein [Sphingobacterium sp.]